MKHLKTFSFFLIVFAFSFSFFNFAGAAGLVPCGPGSTSGLDCNVCDLITLIQNIVNFSISISVVLAVIFILYGGFLILTTESSSRHDDGKKAITYAITGLIIVLGAWLIVDTTLRVFMGSNSPTDWGPWNTFPACQAPTTQTPVVPNAHWQCGTTIPGSGTTYSGDYPDQTTCYNICNNVGGTCSQK